MASRSETTYWPKAGSMTETIVLWFQANPDEFLFAEDLTLKFGIAPSSVAALSAAPMQYGLIKRVPVPHSHGRKYAYMVGDKR